MVALLAPFDVTAFSPVVYPDEIAVSIGTSKTDMRWARREMGFDKFANMLSMVQIGPKDGSCYTPGVFRTPQRKMDNTDQIDIAVIDADCGHTAEEIIAAIEARGWEAVVHSTFSHLTCATDVSIKHYDAWRERTKLDDASAYMREYKGYLPRVIANARIVDERGGNYVVEHAPCPKFRIILRLDRPWRAEEYATQDIANAMWRVRILALAYALGLHHDQSCTDTSRLYYFPRVKDAGARLSFFYARTWGEACPIWDLPEARAAHDEAEGPTLFNRPPPIGGQARAHAAPAGDLIYRSDSGSEINLSHWAASHGSRWEAAVALRTRNPGAFGARRSGVKAHISCPFDGEHTSAGDTTGTYIVNASDIGKAGLTGFSAGFYIGCKHNACAHRDRLEYVRKMLELGWLSIPDLTDDSFLVHEAFDLDPVAATELMTRLRSKEGTRKAAALKDSDNPFANVPEHLLTNLPGILGELCAFIIRTAKRKQPVLALGSTLAGMSAVIGRKVELEGWGTRPNIYCLGLAVTGAGKDRPIEAIKDLFFAAGVQASYLGTEDVSSDTGMLQEARTAGRESHVMLIDEIGDLLAAVNSKFAQSHMAGVVTALLKLYSSSRTIFKSKSFADEKRKFTITEPSISLFGATTPEKLAASLTTDDLSTGLLSRLVLFDAGLYIPQSRPPRDEPIPESILQWVHDWSNVQIRMQSAASAGGNKPNGGVINPMAVSKLVVRKIGMTAEASETIMAFNDEMHEATIRERKHGFDGLYVRANENACKFALIRACAKSPSENIIVDGADARWAVDLSRVLTLRMVALATDNIADSPFQRSIGIFRDIIKRAGARGMTTKELRRHKRCQLPQRDWENVISHLTSSGEVAFVNVNAGKAALNGKQIKAREAYVWTDAKDESDDE